jgi:hypothetical protein
MSILFFWLGTFQFGGELRENKEKDRREPKEEQKSSRDESKIDESD